MLYNDGWEKQQTQRPKGSGPKRVRQAKKPTKRNPANVIYQFVCHCDSRYVGCTSQCLEERIKQHVPRSIANPPASPNRQSLSRSCKANTRPQQFHESSIGQHLLERPMRSTLQQQKIFYSRLRSLFFSPFCS